MLALVDGFEDRQRPRHNGTRGARLLQSTSDEELLLELGASKFGIATLPPTLPQVLPTSQSGSSEGVSGPSETAAATLNDTEANYAQGEQLTSQEAARKILACYRRYRRRIEGGLGDPLWSTYNDRARTLPAPSRPSRRYKIYMRSVIPKALAYLRGVIQRLNKANQSLNQEVSSVPHEKLDDIRSKAKVIRWVFSG